MNARLYLETILPKHKSDAIWQYMQETNCSFRVAKPRKTKRGDFRTDGVHHKISVNQDSNKFRFLLTLIHELAHLKTYIEFKRGAKPHGKEWKRNFSLLFNIWQMEEEFDESDHLMHAILSEKNNASACSGMDSQLERALMSFDDDPKILLGDLPDEAQFIFKNKSFIKLSTRRTRCLCIMQENGKQYTINAAAQVDLCG